MTTTSEDGIARKLGHATDSIIEIKQQVTKNLGHYADSAGALVKKHPLMAVGLGLGIGYLIARLVHR